MGESKVNAANAAQERVSPLTREELKANLDELTIQYRKAVDYIQQLREELQKRDFDYSSFYLSMLFKVMENASAFSQEFVTNCASEIENALTSFHQAISEGEGEKENKDEA